jgi:uncharacterized protein (TIGR02246 family)
MLMQLIFALTVVAAVQPADLAHTIQTVNNEYMHAVSRHDAALASAPYTDDAVWTDGGSLRLRGRKAINTFLAQRFAHQYTFVDGTCRSKIEWSDSETAMEIGSCRTTVKTAKGIKRSGGHFATMWRRQPDGTWKIAANYTPR